VTATQAGSTNYSAAAPVTQTIIVNQIAQTITFAPLASPVTYGVAPMTVSATGGASGNPVIFTITGPATLTGSTLTITGAGTVTITASQAGNTNYSAAPSVSQTLVVNPAAQTITFAPLATPVNYGVTPMTLSATGGASGNPVTFKVISGSATVSGNILTITGAGIVTVAADQAGNANYAAATEVTQTVTVNKIAPAITITSTPTPVFLFNPITLTANIPPPSTNSCLLCSVPTGTVTFLAGSTPLGTATLSGRNAVLTTSLAAVGTYTITAVYNGDSNFSTQTSAPVTEVAVDFTLTGSSTPSQDVLHGTAATYSFVITPVGSSTIPADIKLTLTGFPGASIVTFTPSTMVSASGTTNIVLTVQVPSYPTEAANTNHVPQRALALIALGSLLLPFGRKLRVGSKRAGRFLCLMLLLAGMGAMAGLTGCGAGWNHEDFTPTVTATSGALSHNTEISLRVH
ncbi:MAG TPA: Ig-like domain-containing protein, partial [Acidobacteriaceae bacterium]